MGTTKKPAAPKTRATTTRARRTTTTTKAAPTPPTHDEIASRAQKLYAESGRAPGRDEQNWLEAERQLRAERRL